MKERLLVAVFIVAILSPAKSYGAFDETEMEAWTIHFQVCGIMFQYLASARLEDVAHTMKADLLEVAKASGASQTQVNELGDMFEEGRIIAEHRGYQTGKYPREIEVDEFAKFGERVYKDCVSWSYERPL